MYFITSKSLSLPTHIIALWTQWTHMKHIIVKIWIYGGLAYKNIILVWFINPSTLLLSTWCCRWDMLGSSWGAVFLKCSLAVTGPSEHYDFFFLNEAKQLKLSLKITLSHLFGFVLKGIRSMHTIIWEVVYHLLLIFSQKTVIAEIANSSNVHFCSRDLACALVTG